MIPRSGRPAPRRSSALTLTPTDTSGDLPDWSPQEPPGGWTPEAAHAAAADYADEHAEALGLSPSRVEKLAFRELRRAIPSLGEADVLARLSAAQEEPSEEEKPPF